MIEQKKIDNTEELIKNWWDSVSIAVKNERERCAKICEEAAFDRGIECPNCENGFWHLRYAAKRIREEK